MLVLVTMIVLQIFSIDKLDKKINTLKLKLTTDYNILTGYVEEELNSPKKNLQRIKNALEKLSEEKA